MDAVDTTGKLDELLSNWTDSEQQTKRAFNALRGHLSPKSDLIFEFVARPGVSYSLRAKHRCQTQRPLFAMIDVIDDDPGQRWLSVCFYGDLISDPQDIGDFVPEGLLGDDAHCFDIDAWDEDLLQYVCDRLDEAYAHAAESTVG